MYIKSPLLSRLVRAAALITLFLGLASASRLLGVTGDAANPMAVMGMPAFVLLATISLALLFAAVGLWIHAAWGTVLLFGATIVEVVLYLADSALVTISLAGFFTRLILALAVAGLWGYVFWRARRDAHD